MAMLYMSLVKAQSRELFINLIVVALNAYPFLGHLAISLTNEDAEERRLKVDTMEHALSALEPRCRRDFLVVAGGREQVSFNNGKLNSLVELLRRALSQGIVVSTT
jgi:hypothetical protein